MATFTNQTKNTETFANLSKTIQGVLVTEDLLNFLVTEDDEILLVEPLIGGFEWSNQTKA